MPSEGDLDARGPKVEELQAFSAKYLDICCVTLHILQINNVTGLVTVLIFDVFCP